jgi:hypothetical protein
MVSWNDRPGRAAALSSMLRTVGLALTSVVLVLMNAPQVGSPLREPHPRSHTAEAVRALLEEHRCWTGAAPRRHEGSVPGHALVTHEGGRTPTLGGERVVRAALGQVFAGRDHRMVVHGFCP